MLKITFLVLEKVVFEFTAIFICTRLTYFFDENQFYVFPNGSGFFHDISSSSLTPHHPSKKEKWKFMSQALFLAFKKKIIIIIILINFFIVGFYSIPVSTLFLWPLLFQDFNVFVGICSNIACTVFAQI